MGEALACFFTAVSNVTLNVLGFVYSLVAEQNYIALAAIGAGIAISGIAVGLLKRKLHSSR